MSKSTEKIVNFLESYKTFKSNTYEGMTTEALNKYSAFFAHFNEARIEALKADKKEASQYNIFSVLKINRREVITHTPILKNLLDPKGSHAQGRLFYDSFIEQMLPGKSSLFVDFKPAFLNVNDEFFISKYGRMDILVQHKSHVNPFAWVIENKIGAVDQENQLSRYYNYLLKELKLSPYRIRIFYLTPTGHEASAASLEEELLEQLNTSGVLIKISYEQHIIKWLTSTLEKVEADVVKHIINQYIKTIKEHCI